MPESWLFDLIPGYKVMKQDPAQVRAALRAILSDALARDVAPVSPPDEEGTKVRFTLSLPAPEASMATALMQERGLTAGPLAKQLVAAMRGQAPREIPVDKSDPLVALAGLFKQGDPFIQVRPEQVELGGNIRDALSRGRIGLVEGGTGVGKTRAMVSCAADYALEHDARVAICAPTLALLRQFALEYQKQANVKEMPALRVIFGRREFVSETELGQMLSDASLNLVSRYPLVVAWLEQGGQPSQSKVIDRPWLISSLVEIAPDFPVDDVRLPEDGLILSDRGYRAYRNQFVETPEPSAELLLCSHAMLAQDLRTRQWAARKDQDYLDADKDLYELLSAYWSTEAGLRVGLSSARDAAQKLRIDAYKDATVGKGLLPDYRVLLLDEAHTFEENCSNALSSYLALRVLVRNLHNYRRHQGRVSKAMIEQVEDFVNDISQTGKLSGRDMVNLKAPSDRVREARSSLNSIRLLLERIPMPRATANPPREKLAAAVQIRRALAVLNAVSNSPSSLSYLRFSPQRTFPSIYIGSTSIERILTTMWDSLDAGAAISATLYLKRHDGMSAMYQRILLGIPEKRAEEYRPVISPWSIPPLKALYTPGKRAAALRPPTHADKLDDESYAAIEKKWLDNLAAELQNIAKSAAGGTLALMTSYANVSGLATRFESTGLSLVVAAQDYPLERQKEDFLRLRRDGHRPLWFALGGAWTGLDVGGHDPWTDLFGESLAPDEDNVLTDLVIPRLPFGTNQSLSHIWRVNNRPGMPWELFETVFRFKQGLGRLIRRDGLPRNRRIWMLDGRLHDVNANSAYALFTQLLSIYPLQDLE